MSVAWLLLWLYQYPWYAAMVICLLVLYPPSRLDGLVLAPIGSISDPLGIPGAPLGHAAELIHDLSVRVISPLVLFAAAAGLVALCLTGRWNLRGPDAYASPRSTCPPSPREAA